MPVVKKINKDITQVIYSTVEEMNKAFCRISGYGECPKFQGQIFTLGEYRKWYSEEYGGWTYYEDFHGHNIPCKSMEPFWNGDFDPLTPEEEFLVNLTRHKARPHYIIGTSSESRESANDHELAHALFGTNEAYRKKATELINKYSKELKEVKALLIKLGYNSSVFIDEAHAYTGIDSTYLDNANVKYPTKLRDELVDLYNKYKPTLNLK